MCSCHNCNDIQNHKCCEGGKRVVHLAGEAIGLELYPRLMTIITVTEDLDPQLRRLGWVLRLMDKLYDSRYEHASSIAATLQKRN